MTDTPKCPFCKEATVTTSLPLTFRREGKSLTVELNQWKCPRDCKGPRGNKPYVFSTFRDIEENVRIASEKWLTEFGEEMPPAVRGSKVFL